MGCCALGLVVLLCYRGPLNVLARLDHETMLADFVIYMDQVRRLHAPRPTMAQHWTYPPLLASLLLVLGHFKYRTAWTVWLIFELACVAALLRLCGRQLRGLAPLWRWSATAGLVLFCLPVLHCFKWGQISTLITLLAIAGLSGSGWRAGLLLGGAVGLKAYPAAYGIVYLVRRDWRGLLRLVAGSLLFGVLVPLVVLGPQATLMLLMSPVSALLHPRSNPGGSTIGAAIELWFHKGINFGEGDVPWVVELPLMVRRLLNYGLSLAVVAGSVIRTRQRRAGDPVTAATIITALALVIWPGWIHYFVILSFANAVLLCRAGGRPVVLWVTLLAWILNAAGLIAFLIRPHYFFLFKSLSTTTLAAICTLLGLLLLEPEKQV